MGPHSGRGVRHVSRHGFRREPPLHAAKACKYIEPTFAWLVAKSARRCSILGCTSQVYALREPHEQRGQSLQRSKPGNPAFGPVPLKFRQKHKNTAAAAQSPSFRCQKTKKPTTKTKKTQHNKRTEQQQPTIPV